MVDAFIECPTADDGYKVPNVTLYLVFVRPWVTIQNYDQKSLRV
jgi:hypothetical protein